MLNICSSPNSGSTETDAGPCQTFCKDSCSTDVIAWLIVGPKIWHVLGKAQTWF